MTAPAPARAARVISPADAAGLVRSGDWLDYGATLCQPDLFDRALAERASELTDVRIRATLSVRLQRRLGLAVDLLGDPPHP